jgi:hypothetical protein
MQAWYPAAFEREMGCTAAELRAQLPGACAGRPIELGADHARVVVGQGTLRIEWRTLAPRRIALLNIPRLAVSFQCGFSTFLHSAAGVDSAHSGRRVVARRHNATPKTRIDGFDG